jgi:S1-C subfamily serine protease
MSEVLQQLSSELASIVERVGPSVVRVEGRRGGPSSGAVWSADGLVVTASHVVEWEEGIEVGLPDGSTVNATLVGRDPSTDVAVLRAAASGLTPASWSGTDGLKVGQLVVGVSRPGRSARAGLGIVSALGDSWRTRLGGRVDRYVQSDVDRHPGYSGSVLAAAGGGALGLNTSGLVRSAGIVVPASTLRRVVDALLAHGQVRRGFLGVGTYPVALPAPLQQQLSQRSALLVVSVQANSPAERAGLVLGDALVAFDGHATRQPADLLPLLEEDRIGATVTARVLRAGELRDVSVTIGTRETPASS